MSDFFVSYNQADEAWAKWIAWTLEEAGHHAIIQAWDFRPGGNFVLEMQKAAASAEKTIAVLSEDYLSSEFTHPEWAAAFRSDPRGAERKLIPVRVHACNPTGILGQIIYLDLVNLEKAEARKVLLEAILHRVKPILAPKFPSLGKVKSGDSELSDSRSSQLLPTQHNLTQLSSNDSAKKSDANLINSDKSVVPSMPVDNGAISNTAISCSTNIVDYNMNQQSVFSIIPPFRKILVLAANPKNSTRLRLDEEVRDISEGMRRAKHRDNFEIIQRWAVRPRDLQRAMLETQPQIIHFSGHGEGEAGLYFENETGHASLVTDAALFSLFKLFFWKTNIECVVLNGCYSERQAKVISGQVPYAIGMKNSIEDKAAIEFSVGFYDALGNGESIEFAFESGKVAMALNSKGSVEMPILLTERR